MGARRNWTKLVRIDGHRTQRKGKKGRNMILFTSCEGPYLDILAVSHRFTTNNNNLTWDWCITWYRHVSKHNIKPIYSLRITCVSAWVFIVEFKTTTAASGTIALGSKAPSFSYILNAVIFLMARPGFESRVDQYIFILHKRITRVSCDYSVILTVLWNFNMHIFISIH